MMNNFKEVANPGQYKVCDHAYKLQSIGCTFIIEQPILDVPMEVYKFTNFRDIVSRNYQKDMLIGMFSSTTRKLILCYVNDQLNALNKCNWCITLNYLPKFG